MSYPKLAKPPLTLRAAHISDAEEISALIIKSVNYFHTDGYTEHELAIWRRGYSPSKVKSQLTHRLSKVLDIEGEIAGFIQFDPPEIKGFYIKPEYSGQGLGSVLLQNMLMTLKVDGHTRIELTSNKMTVDFYKKFGFKLMDEEIVYWENHPFIEYRMIKTT